MNPPTAPWGTIERCWWNTDEHGQMLPGWEEPYIAYTRAVVKGCRPETCEPAQVGFDPAHPRTVEGP